MDPNPQIEGCSKKESNIQFITDFPDLITEETLLKYAPDEKITHAFQLSQFKTKQNAESSKKKGNQNQQSTTSAPAPTPNIKEQNTSIQGISAKIDPSKLVSKEQSNNTQQTQHPNNNSKKADKKEGVDDSKTKSPPKQKADKKEVVDDSKSKSPQKQKQGQKDKSKKEQKKQKKAKEKETKEKEPKQKETKAKETKQKETKGKETKQNEKGNKKNKAKKDETPSMGNSIPENNTSPFVYSFNRYEYSIFDQQTRKLSKMNLTTFDSFNDIFMPSEKVSSYILLDSTTFVYSTPNELIVHSEIYGDQHVQLANVTELRPDFTIDMLHFYALSNKSLYIFQYHNGEVLSRLLHKNVDAFDFCRQFLAISKKEMVKIYRRTDFNSSPINKMAITAEIKIFCDDNYLYLFNTVKHQVTSYFISPNQSLRSFQIIDKVANVFSSDEIIFLMEDHITFKVKDSIYKLANPTDYIILYDNVIAIFDNKNETAKSFSFEASNKLLDTETVKSDVNDAISLVQALNSTYDSYMDNLNQLILNSVPVINQSFESLQLRLNEVSEKIKLIESKAMKSGGSPEMCIRLFESNPDLAFRVAGKYSINNLLALCKHNNSLVDSLNSNQLSDETKLEIAEIFTDNIMNRGIEIVPLFLPLLLSFDPENEIVKARLKPLVDTILSASMGLFPSVSPSSSVYMDLRRLTHIAMSFKNI